MFYGNGVAIQIFPFASQFNIFSKIVSLEDIRFKVYLNQPPTFCKSNMYINYTCTSTVRHNLKHMAISNDYWNGREKHISSLSAYFKFCSGLGFKN